MELLIKISLYFGLIFCFQCRQIPYSTKLENRILNSYKNKSDSTLCYFVTGGKNPKNNYGIIWDLRKKKDNKFKFFMMDNGKIHSSVISSSQEMKRLREEILEMMLKISNCSDSINTIQSDSFLIVSHNRYYHFHMRLNKVKIDTVFNTEMIFKLSYKKQLNKIIGDCYSLQQNHFQSSSSSK